MRSWIGPLLAATVVAGAALVVRAQDEEGAAPAPRASAVEVKLMVWRAEDTMAVLRAATGDSISEASTMLRSIAERSAPKEAPEVQAAVDERVAERLAEAGAEGYELVWVRETSTVVDGYVLPAPALFLQRRAP
jgi:hypothetical protein